MAAEQSPTRGRVSRGTLVRFWIGVVVVVAVAGSLLVVGVWSDVADRDQTLAQLNARYVEEIGFTSRTVAGRSERLVVIDGETRDDCDEEDGRLTCSGDPRPTRE